MASKKILSILLIACFLWACGRGRTPIPGALHTQTTVPANLNWKAKIIVRNSGMLRVSLSELKAIGFPGDKIDRARMRLTYRGQEAPFLAIQQSDQPELVFYSSPSDSLYTVDAVYILEWGANPGVAMAKAKTRSPADAKEEDVSIGILRFEENTQYAPLVEQGERWLWRSLPAPQEANFPFFLEDIRNGQARLSVELWASTEALNSPDHHVRLLVNGQLALDEAWDGRGRRRLEAALPPGLLVDGENTLTIQAMGDTGAPADIAALDWFQIEYSHSLVARDGSLEFSSRGAPQALRGLGNEVWVFDITDPRHVIDESRNLLKRGQSLVFTGEAGRRYLAVDETGFQKPDRILPAALFPQLSTEREGAEYMAIGPADLLEPLEPLLAWRTAQGLRTMSVPLEAIYDQFGDGFPEPEAIVAFLSEAVSHWRIQPRYVLLVGDATYDPRGYLSAPEANRLPVMFLYAESGGETASDALFAMLDGDGWPDLALGRVPARQPEQVRVFVEKTLAYERNSSPGDWRKRILAIADGQEPAFRGDAQLFLDEFSADYERVLYSPEAGVGDAAEQIKTRLEDGAIWVAYFGHGSLNLWGKDRLFHAENVEGLNNRSRLPVILQMTCLTGLFTHPKNESLSERLLFYEGGGAAALLAPTSLTLPIDQGFLSIALAQAYVQNPSARLGDLLLAAQRQIPLENAGTREVMLTYVLLGDPGLRLASD